MKKPAHLIRIKNGKPTTACGTDWVGANLTKELDLVRCERCINTDHFKTITNKDQVQ